MNGERIFEESGDQTKGFFSLLRKYSGVFCQINPLDSAKEGDVRHFYLDQKGGKGGTFVTANKP